MKRFIAVLEHHIRTLNWTMNGTRINKDYLSHLIFADNIDQIAKSRQKLQEQMNEHYQAYSEIRQKMNDMSTKIPQLFLQYYHIQHLFILFVKYCSSQNHNVCFSILCNCSLFIKESHRSSIRRDYSEPYDVRL